MSSEFSNQAVRVSRIPPWERRRHPRFELKTEALVVDMNAFQMRQLDQLFESVRRLD